MQGNDEKIGLMNCSGACYPALLCKRACNVAAYKSDNLTEACLVQATMALLSENADEIEKSRKVLNSYAQIIAVNACSSACTTKLLKLYDIEPKEFHLSDVCRIKSKALPYSKSDVDQLLSDNLDSLVRVLLKFSKDISV